jgi:pyruvate/2-oxoglutarate dehydrogenase complex dihydrolipoamide dehydrogenase (E3) component
VASARVAHLARRGAEYGLRIPAVEIDFPAVIERARRIAAVSRASHDRAFAAAENPCPYQKLYPAILVMQAAENRV